VGVGLGCWDGVWLVLAALGWAGSGIPKSRHEGEGWFSHPGEGRQWQVPECRCFVSFSCHHEVWHAC